MIRVPFPHMALNAPNVPGSKYKMWNTWEVSNEETVDHILNWTATVAKTAPGGKLETLVLNAHGNEAIIYLGQTITYQDATKFAILNGLVTRIWITACSVAKGEGHSFCSQIAKSTGAWVKASTVLQYRDFWLPFGYIDGWEGEVVTFDPEGNSTTDTLYSH